MKLKGKVQSACEHKKKGIVELKIIVKTEDIGDFISWIGEPVRLENKIIEVKSYWEDDKGSVS